MTNKLNIDTSIELIEEQAEASVSLNPLYQWAKVVITDDMPNANKQRIPETEFDNLIKTGIHAPIKMDFGKISDHKESLGKPIGVIAQIVRESNKLIALAALWKKEREDDVKALKQMFLDGTPPQVSWEISYTDSTFEDDVENLAGTILNGLAVVANPAYTGRTAFVAMSSVSDKKEEIPVEELETLKAKVAELETTLAEKEALLAELETLRAFKTNIEKAQAEEDKIKAVKEKFVSAGIEKPEEYFTDNRDRFLALSEDALDFIIQELVAFSEKQTSASDKTKKVEIPDIKNNDNLDDLSDPKILAKKLREMNK